MDKETEGAALSGTETATAATQDMGEQMSQSQYADFLQKAKKATAGNNKEGVETEETAAEQPEEARAETVEPEATEEGVKAEGDEQPEEQPESEEEEVLSQSESNKPDKLAKWQEKTQKRFNELTAKAKEAEEKAARLEQELVALKTRPQPEEKAPESIPVPVSDPSDKTSTVFDESEITKLESEAMTALTFIEENQPAILRALAKDEATVKIGNQEFPVDELSRIQREAKKHVERYIPQRKQFLAVHKQSVAEAYKLMPQLKDKNSQEYQDMQQLRRVLPAVNQIPVFEQWYALGKIGQAYLQQQQQQQKKATEVKPAAATPPKAAADTASTAAPAKKGQSGEKAVLKAQLEKAEKEAKSTGSKDSYARVLELKSRLKRIS